MPKVNRKNPSKRLRFEVFKRDFFTCQYCGGQPPHVVLVADHIDPVARGGSSEIDNLITACEACNQGKADRPIEQRQVRPDADLLYLETQQEIAELRRFQAAVEDRDRALQRVVALIQEQWYANVDLDWCPGDRVIRQMLARYSPDVVLAAVLDIAPKVESGYLKEWPRYLWTVARNISTAREEQEEASG